MVHFVDAARANERTVPCGTPVPRPPSEIGVLVTAPGRIAQLAHRLAPRTANGPRTDTLAIPIAPAARLQVELAPMLGDEPMLVEVVSLLVPRSEAEDTVSVQRFLILDPGASADVAVPPGPVVVFARQLPRSPNPTPRYLAMAGPLDARRESRTEVTLEKPGVPALVVHITGPGIPLDVALVGADQSRLEPAVTVRGIEGQRLLWPEVHGPEFVVDGESASAYLEPMTVSPRPRSVELVEVVARRKPAIEVVLVLPSGLTPERLALEVARMPGWVPEREAPLPLDATSWRLEDLPPDTVMLTLHAAPWRFRQRVDLRDGEDLTAHFAPEPIMLTGTVYRGDDGVAATVALNVDLLPEKGQVAVATDEWGRYEIVVFRPGTYVAQVDVESGEAAPPMREIVEVPERSHVEWNFHLAAREIEVQVRDAETAAPIEGATVSFLNRAEGSNQDDGRPVRTDVDGLARSATLRPGTLRIDVDAEGYVEHRGEPRDLGSFPEEPWVVELVPIGDIVELGLSLADGLPAAGARVTWIDDLMQGTPRWSGTADGGGLIRLPKPKQNDAGFLLARHPEAASAIRAWSASAADEASPWHLAPTAGRALRIRATDADDQPEPHAEIQLRLGPHRISGLPLQLLTGSPPTTDRDGHWLAHGLPAGPVTVLTFSPALRELARRGALDGLAERVPYPWPELFDVPVIEH